jgi:hypothetical protein
MRDIVWTATVDSNKWRVDVVRKTDYTADLQVYRVDDETMVHEEEVGLSYRALFGPDIADAALWQDIAIAVIDAQ